MQFPVHLKPKVIFGVLIAASLVALGLPFASSAADKAAPAKSHAALTVSTTSLVAVEWPALLTANGNIAAWQEAIVGAEASGLRLTDVLVNVGDRVRKGQVLARLQSETVAAELEQTQASLAEAEASLAEAHANAERARQVETSGALSALQVAQYLTGEKTAKARVEGLKARLKADRIRLAQTQILAPDDGTVSARSATLGAVVQAGQELFRLIRRDRLEWRAELPAADLARVKPGMNVRITTAGHNKIAGKVRMVAPTVEAQTRNGLVYIDILERGDARAGMFARGEIELSRGKVLVLPQNAVLLRDGFSYVYRIGPDNKVIQTKVTTGARSGEHIAILAGLDANTRVVGSGVGFLSDGDLVRVTPAAKAK